VTDRQTDGRTELGWLRRATAVAAIARKNKRIFTKLSYHEYGSSGFESLVPITKVTAGLE